MLKPEYFYGKSDKMLEYYRGLEDYLLQDIAKFLIKAGEIGGKADRELFILQQMGMTNSEIIERLSILADQTDAEVKKILKESVMTSFSEDKEVLDNYFDGEYGPLDNPEIMDVMQAEYEKTSGELNNLTRTTMSQRNSDLITLLNETEIRVASGAESYSSAVCKVLDAYAAKGMMIDYPSGFGRSLEAAVRCCVVTSMNQTAAQVTNKYIAEGGVEYVLISAHEGARHSKKGGLYSHDEWQGKPYKIVGSEPGYPNLLEKTGYTIDTTTGLGTVVNPAGLHGYNCRHSHQPWDKGMRNPWIKEDGSPVVRKEDSIEKYNLQQQQRNAERKIRETKRELVMKQAEIDNLTDDSWEMANAKADYDALAYKLSERNKAYNKFCEDNDLQKQRDRLKTAGFSLNDSKKASGRARSWKKQNKT